jgi:hypothetical protein
MPDQNTVVDAGAVDVFLKSGPGQTAVMATIVTFAGQAAAQVGLAPPGPTLAAIVFALLVAFYNVWTVQKVRGLNCLVLIPIVSLVAFTSGWGANGLIGAATSGGKADQSDLVSLLNALKQENTSLAQRLSIQADELRILRQLSGVRAGSSDRQSGSRDGEGASTAHLLSRALGLLAPPAQAQPATTTTAPPSAADRERLLGELQKFQARQKELADDAERLRKEREEAERRAQELQKPQQGLWKKW